MSELDDHIFAHLSDTSARSPCSPRALPLSCKLMLRRCQLTLLLLRRPVERLSSASACTRCFPKLCLSFLAISPYKDQGPDFQFVDIDGTV